MGGEKAASSVQISRAVVARLSPGRAECLVARAQPCAAAAGSRPSVAAAHKRTHTVQYGHL